MMVRSIAAPRELCSDAHRPLRKRMTAWPPNAGTHHYTHLKFGVMIAT